MPKAAGGSTITLGMIIDGKAVSKRDLRILSEVPRDLERYRRLSKPELLREIQSMNRLSNPSLKNEPRSELIYIALNDKHGSKALGRFDELNKIAGIKLP